MINSAQVRNLAEQNSGIQAAYNGFITRYRQIPGDWTAGAATTAIGVVINTGGNGNGYIDNSFTEAAAAWEQLARSNFLTGGFTPTSATVRNETAYMAAAPVNAFNGTLTLTRNEDYGTSGGTSTVRLNLHLGNNIPVSIARELDLKVDDSKTRTGTLRLTEDTSHVFHKSHALNAGGGTADCDDNGDYEIVADVQDCGLVYLY